MKKIFEALETVGKAVTITELQTEVAEMSEYSNEILLPVLSKKYLHAVRSESIE